MTASIEQAIRDEASKLGFVACGFAAARGHSELGANLSLFIAEGHHGEMSWMEERARQRAAPTALWPDAKSVIALAMSYAPATDPRDLEGEGSVGRISAYAQGRDYHKTVKKGLKALARFMPGPAFWAAVAVRTKIPVPMTAPMPRRVNWNAPRERLSDFFSAVARIASSDLIRPKPPCRGADVAILFPFRTRPNRSRSLTP